MTKSKIKVLRNKSFLAIILVVSIIGGMRTYDDVKNNNKILEHENKLIINTIEQQYNNRFQDAKDYMHVMGIYLSNSYEIEAAFHKKDQKKLYSLVYPVFKEFNKRFKNLNIIHFHTKNHISFLRVHKKEKSGDNLKNIRPMITKAISSQSYMEGFEHGKYDKNQVTFREVFPLYFKSEFLGVVEIGLDISYIMEDIAKDIKKVYNRETFILNLIKKDTINFSKYSDFSYTIGDYLLDTNSTLKKMMNTFDNKLENNLFCYEHKYYLSNKSSIHLDDSEGNILGSYFYIIDTTNNIKQNRWFFYTSIAKPIVALLLLLILTNWIFKYFYQNFLKLEKRIRSILDAQSSLTFLSNGVNIIDSNKAFLDFYGFTSLKEFQEKYTCICNTFEKGEKYLQKDNDGISWIEYLLNEKIDTAKVAIKNLNGNLDIFTIVLNVYEKSNKIDSEYYVITLTNITNIEKANTQLIEQSKQASLGEMIGNIAHQWRQPLSAIASLASGISLKSEFGIIDNKSILKGMDQIVGKTQYLSQTIDTFRNFIKEEKEIKKVVLQDRIDTALDIVSASLEANYIGLVREYKNKENIEFTLVLGELTQVIINIVNNAKDAIVENGIKDGFIKIDMKRSEKEVFISIEDNAGGIPKNLLNKIFEPYFTTKHQSVGTGLGLFMSYKIVSESMHGNLSVENSDYGAKFIITLPLFS